MAVPDKEAQPVRRGRAAVVRSDTSGLALGAFARMGFTDPVLVLRWAEIAGPEVAKLCRPFRFSEGPSGGTLTLKALPGAALFLAHETRALAERINAFLGRPAVAKLKFVQGVFALRPSPPAPRPPRPLTDGDPVRRFAGPDNLAQALQALAQRRQRD